MGAASVDNDLAAMLDQVWAMLVTAVDDRRAPLHVPVVASGTPDGPEARIMVLRGAERAAHRLRFHTDRRAAKVAAFIADPRVAVTGYDAEARLQLRLRGTAMLADADFTDPVWAATDAFGRRAYRTTLPPASRLDAPGSGLPPMFEQVRAGDPPSEEGRENFAVVAVVLDRIEWLKLAHTGHRRARYVRIGDAWTGHWLVP